MRRLEDVAAYVRSKNAGPFWVTIDVFCDDAAAFEAVARAPGLQAEAIAQLYGLAPADVRIFPDRRLKVVKISFPRPVVAGAFTDRDAHAGQMFVPLLATAVA